MLRLPSGARPILNIRNDFAHLKIYPGSTPRLGAKVPPHRNASWLWWLTGRPVPVALSSSCDSPRGELHQDARCNCATKSPDDQPRVIRICTLHSLRG